MLLLGVLLTSSEKITTYISPKAKKYRACKPHLSRNNETP